MQAIKITEPGGPEVLQEQTYSNPEIKSGEVLIEVKAAGVNRPDVMQRLGYYPAPPGAPVDIPGLEVAGIIAQVSNSETQWKVGDKVCALITGGGYAEYAVAPSVQCLPVPVGLDFEQAASIPETFFTVWTNIFDRAGFKTGDTCLVHGGTSGIGVTAIQMIKAMGGTVYITAGSEEKCDFAQKLGADASINYRTEDFVEEILKLSPKGIDIVLDMVGGDYANRNLDVLRPEGKVVIINAMKDRFAELDLMKIMMKRLTITGSTLRARDSVFKQSIANNLRQNIWPFLENGKIKPVIHAVFDLKDADQAHALMESSKHIGKIILKVS